MECLNNPDLQLAFDFVRYTNRNIFLTGKAGTGKTTFLRELRKSSPKRMIVLAPTGVAAINAGGVTIHSFFQLAFHPYIPSLYLAETPGKLSEKREKSGYRMSREKINIIRSLDLLIIDEISMVRADTLDAVDAALRRYKNHHQPFGGVQVLMIGDLQQLAPVVRNEDMQILGEYYRVFYFFGSRALSCTDYLTIELKHIYRQNDPVFIDLLNKVRENNIDRGVLDELNKRYIADFNTDSDGGYITLTTHNYQSQAINDSKLEKLPGRTRLFRATVKDDFPEMSYPNVSELILKKDAQVMFVKNDITKDKLYFNGKIGKVESFEEDAVMVRCPGDDFSIRVEPVEWQNVKYTLNEETKEIEETVIGTFIQYPLRLAWAITIHKSQGLTFERAVIDARSAFAHGQVYVALSRCRSLDGLILNSRINQNSIIDDPVISGFVKESERNQPDEKVLAESRRTYEQALLAELFDFSILARNLGNCLKVVTEHHSSILGKPAEQIEKALSLVRVDVIEVSDKFGLQVKRLSGTYSDVESNPVLQDRIKKATVFFVSKLEASLEGILEGLPVETDNRAVKKSINEALDRLKKEFAAKLSCLNSAMSGFSTGKYLDAKARACIESPAPRNRAAETMEESGQVLHPALFLRFKEWRQAKADEMDLPYYMILPQKTLVTLANILPRSMSSLKKIKGMGKKKAGKFGEEILDIIISYCNEAEIEPPCQNTEDEKPKKVKSDTRKLSFDLFSEGRSIAEIAGERSLTMTTIEGHLAHFVSTGEIPVSAFVSQETTELISGFFDGSEDLKMGPVKAILGDRVSWSDLKFVTSHLKFLRSKKVG